MSWKELRQLLYRYEASAGPFALATLVGAIGSSYRQPGARLLVTTEGETIGRISPGCLEDELVPLSLQVIADGTARRRRIELKTRFACDGSIDVFVERIERPNSFFAQLGMTLRERRPMSAVIDLGGTSPSTGMLQQPTLCGEKAWIQHLFPPWQLAVLGGLVDTEPLLRLAEFLGWEASVVTDPPAFQACDEWTACVIASHQFGRDSAAVRYALESEARYVALVGSRKRRKLIIHELLSAGVEERRLKNLFGPAGLDIGSETAEEIALSIAAEVQTVLTGRSSAHLRDRNGHIHAGARAWPSSLP